MSGRRAADRAEIGRFVDALFRYATHGAFVSLRSFFHDPRRPPADIRGVELFLDEVGLEPLIIAATGRATHVANLGKPTVFAPPIATFAKRKSAKEADLVDGLALTAECDAHSAQAKALLEGLIGAATVVVASGGTWTDAETGEVHDKLHLHWRLGEPTREPDDHQRLKRARRLLALLAESDTSAVPLVHPLRWPGTWHLKGEPRMARIVECHPDREVHLEEALGILDDAANLRGIPLDDEPHRTNGDATPADDDDLMALARAIPNDADTSWEHWNVVGMAFWAASSGSDAGFAAFDLWSSKSPKSGASGDGGTTAARWRHYVTSPPTKLSLGKLVYLARQADKTFRLPSWDRHDDYDPFGIADGEAAETKGDARFDLSHDGLALDMGRTWHVEARHVALLGKWLFWAGSHWEFDEKLAHMTRTRDYLRCRADSLVRAAAEGMIEGLEVEQAEVMAKILRSAPTVNNVVGLARSNPELVATVEQWDAHPFRIGTP